MFDFFISEDVPCPIQYTVTVITRSRAEIKGQNREVVIAFHLEVIWGGDDFWNQQPCSYDKVGK